MSRNAIIVTLVAAIVVAVLGGWFAYRSLGGVSEAEYAKAFTESCQDARRQALVREGKAAADAQTESAAYCACALDIVGQMPMSERRAMEKDNQLAQKVAANVLSKCTK